MENLDFPQHDGLLDFGPSAVVSTSPDEPRSHTYPPFYHHTHAQTHHRQSQSSQQQQQPVWPPLGLDGLDGDMSHPHYLDPSTGSTYIHHPQSQHGSRPSSNHGRQVMSLQTASLPIDYASMFRNEWDFQLQQAAAAQQQLQQIQQHQQEQQRQQRQRIHLQHHMQQQFASHEPESMHANPYPTFTGQLQSSPVDFVPVTNADYDAVASTIDTANYMSLAGPMDSMNALVGPYSDYQNDVANSFSASLQHALNHAADASQPNLRGSSPTGTIVEVQSLSDGEWTAINFNTQRQSLDSLGGTVSNPSQNLHIRTNSDSSSSSEPDSAPLSGSYEEIPPWPLSSPQDEFHSQNYIDSHYLQHGLPNPGNAQPQTSPSSSLAVSPSSGAAGFVYGSSSSSTSPVSSGPTSPRLDRRKAPGDKVTKVVVKKTVAHVSRKDAIAERKKGRRHGPLRPDQRQSAHEIRKLRACLRCKFLKKTCDKGEPCGGCRPSHARLWQVPCTRLDIKDIAYFMKDWKADYERHVSLGFSVHNIKGFSTVERTLYITHGYGHYLPINAREVFVREDKCFDVNWVESIHEAPREFEVNTAKLSAGIEGVSTSMLSEYLDRHLDSGFEAFVDDYFEGTAFLTEILKTVYAYYRKAKTPSLRKALKLVLAYNLTLHLTMVEGLSEEEQFIGRIDNPNSKFNGKTFAPVMINFQVKCALADMWRELQKDILEELSSLYSSVYSGEKLKNWPTIFMLATILLAIWEEMQFDCHYRVPDEKAVEKFCDDMETTPVGVIVGLFQAISTKLPALYEWDTRKHQHLLGSDMAICDALTEVKGHVNRYERYLKDRATNAKFDRNDFDSLSNKFLSKLVIRAN